MPTSGDFVVGARRWIAVNEVVAIKTEIAYQDPALYFHKKIQDGLTETTVINHEGLFTLCELAGVELLNPRALQREHKEATAIGSTVQFGSNQASTKLNGRTYSVFRSFTSSWLDTDGTLFISAKAEGERTKWLTSQGHNTCAADAFLFMAISLNLWRCQMDQISEIQLEGKETPSVCLYLIVRTGWDKLKLEGRNKLRDLLLDTLHKSAPITFPLRQFQPASELVTSCTHGIPQMTFTWVSGQQCCTNPLRWRKNHLVRPVQQNMIQCTRNGGVTLQDMVENFFGCQNREDLSPCRKQGCVGAVKKRRRIIVDRLPPTLAFTIDFLDGMRSTRTYKVTDDIRVCAQLNDGNESDSIYRLCGMIIMVGMHFTARFCSSDGRLSVYDGLKNRGRPERRKKTKKVQWIEDWGNDWFPVVLFLRKRDE